MMSLLCMFNNEVVDVVRVTQCNGMQRDNVTRFDVVHTHDILSTSTNSTNDQPDEYMTVPTSDSFQSLKSHNPGRSTLIDTLSTFAFARSPPFIHIHDPFTHSQTQVLLTELLQTLSETSRTTNRERRLAHAIVDCTLCFTPKLLFTSILNGLAEFEPTWVDGYRSWVFEDENGERRNENPGDGADVFLENLREFLGGETTGRGAVVVFVNPENMKYGNSNMMSTMSRLRELVRALI